MKNMFTRRLVLSLLVMGALVFGACHKDAAKVTITGSSTGDNMTDQTVTASVQGRVVDETGSPMQGATVTSGAASTTTDVNGQFVFKNISMSSRFGYVQVSKSGYFNGSRSIITTSGESSYVSIQMIPRTLTSSFSATSGGTVTVGTGNSAAFTASSVVTAATNAAYTGTVNVFAKYLDPTDTTTARTMPGTLRGTNTAGKESALQSFGMLLVELQGASGEKLQLASGKTATLTWTIPSKLLASAPATIPLWYFNDSTGKWIEQGTATKTGNTYVGTVGHFTYWNVDVPVSEVGFSVRVVDQNDNPLPGLAIEIATAGGLYVNSGYTDDDGDFNSWALQSDTAVQQVRIENALWQTLAMVNVNPTQQNINLGTITITVPGSVVFKGTVVDCSSNPVDSGYVALQFGSLVYRVAVTRGAFVFPWPKGLYTSVSSILATPYDFSTQLAGSQQTINVPSGSDTVDCGQLSSCGIRGQYLTITYVYYGLTQTGTYSEPAENISYTYQGNITDIRLLVPGGGVSGTTDLFVQGPITTAGTYPDGLFSSGNTMSFNPDVTILSVGDVGGWIIGTFAGDYNGSPANGSFRIKRTE